MGRESRVPRRARVVSGCPELHRQTEREGERSADWLGVPLADRAQWEYACRGGAKSFQKYHFGDTLSKEDANFANKLARTEKVGSHAANRFGLHDMHGNVWEMCLDWHDKEYKSADPDFKGSLRVARGGSWFVSSVVTPQGFGR